MAESLHQMEPMGMVLDTATALERVEGDRELLQELAQMFLEHAPVMMAELREACDRRDGDALQRAAHSLKGSAGNLAADEVCETARKLELMGHAGDLSDCARLLAELEAEMARLEAALTELA